MADWTEGYVADIGYTYGYYSELNPLRSRIALLHAGLAIPTVETACELGFGQGLSVNIHAASMPVRWHGTDFNPAQVAFARDLAGASSADIALSDEAFADFARRHDLPEFDYIGLHGIWSWISNENRAVIVDFVRRKLKVGGVLYISYNTLPGWAAFAPLRHLMTEHAELIGAEGHGIVNRINGAIDFIDKFIATNPAYLRANAQIAERFKHIKEQNRHYLAHEYFNRDWDPMHFGTLARWLAPAKVTFGCSANYMDHFDGVSLTPDQRTYLAEIPEHPAAPIGPRLHGERAISPRLLGQGRTLAFAARAGREIARRTGRSDHAAVGRSAGSQGAVGRPPRFVRRSMSRYSICSTITFPGRSASWNSALSGKGIAFTHLVEAVIILIGMGHLAPAQPADIAAAARKCTDRLNARLLDAARGKADVGHLASPITAGGVSRPAFSTALPAGQGTRLPGSVRLGPVRVACPAIANERIIKESKLLETPEQNLVELNSQATAFAERLSLLTALQVA